MRDNLFRERILAIVSLIAQYAMEDRDLLSDTEIVEELLAVGFAEEEIDAAFGWVETLTLQPAAQPSLSDDGSPRRVFSRLEMRQLSCECRGFLGRMRELGIIDDLVQEEIIDKAMQADEALTLQEMKMITALTIFARSHDRWRREVDCIMEDDWSRLYN